MKQNKYKKVLLVDDSEIDNFINTKLIKKSGFAEEIIATKSAREGLEYLQNQAKKPEHLPDIIFLDILMPVMDGFDFIDEFIKLPETIKKKCKIILLSSSESFKDLNRANKNPQVHKFLNKPLTENHLAAIT